MRPRLGVVLALLLVSGMVAAVLFQGVPLPVPERSPGDDPGFDPFAGLDLTPCRGALAKPPRGTEAATVREIARSVEDVRELQFERVPEPVYVSPERLALRVRASLARERAGPDAAAQELTLELLGAVPPDLDLEATLSEILGAQVLGYYDTQSGDLVVGAGRAGQELSGRQKVTLAHELQHALADQALGLPVTGNPDPGEEDAQAAALALVEGDATLTSQLFALGSLSLEEQLQLAAAPGAGSDGLQEVPHYVARSVLFPYVDGLEFACGLHGGVGWSGVDRAYRLPPATTAQVLFPERYEAGEDPLDPRDPGSLSGPWERADTSALGAADLLFLFEAPGNDRSRALDRPTEAAAAWAGGEMHLWTRGEQGALGVTLRQRAGEPSLCRSMELWYRAAFATRDAPARPGERVALDGNRQDAVLRCTPGEVRLGIGPRLGVARALAA